MEDRLQTKINQGRQASMELEILREVFAEFETSLMNAWRTSRDEPERNNIWYLVNALGKLQDLFTKRVVDGRMAEHALQDLIHGPQKAA